MKKIVGFITFGAFEWVWLGIIIFLTLTILLYRYRRTVSVARLLSMVNAQSLLKNFSLGKQRLKIILMSVGLLLLYLGLLRPQWQQKKEVVAQEGRDLFIALDISRSMLAGDCTPNRLSCAKSKIKELLPLLSATRVGLVLFSGDAFVQCPLTADYAAFNLFLDTVDVENISSGSTNVQAAIEKVIEVFNSMAGKKNKLLIMFTDGEDFSSDLQVIKSKAQEIGLSIFTVGVGTVQGAPIPLYDNKGNKQGHQKDQQDKIVISRLNEQLLYNLATDLGGTYLKYTSDASDITAVARLIKQFEKEKFADTTVAQLQEQYPYFLLVAFFCFLGEWLC